MSREPFADQNAAGDWSVWGIGAGVLTAGCYQLAVASSKGRWTATLAMGS